MQGRCFRENDDNEKFIENMIGNNFRLGEMEASIGIEQLKKLNTIIKARLKISKYLINKLKKIKFIKLPIKIIKI